ncbi:LamB/YcsF family protein, partial [Pseudomonas aeruginosa]
SPCTQRVCASSALALEAQTLCVHGDNPASLAAVRRIRDALEAA